MDAYQDMLSDNSDRGSEVCSSTGAPRSFSSKGCRMIVPYDIGLSNWRYVNKPYNYILLRKCKVVSTLGSR